MRELPGEVLIAVLACSSIPGFVGGVASGDLMAALSHRCCDADDRGSVEWVLAFFLSYVAVSLVFVLIASAAFHIGATAWSKLFRDSRL